MTASVPTMRPAAAAGIAAAILAAAGASEQRAHLVARYLLRAELRGHASHGLGRVDQYVAQIRGGSLDPRADASIAVDHGALAVIDGNRGFGQAAAARLVDEAAERARAHGIALVALRRSGHVGRLADWAEDLATLGLVSLHFVNTVGVPGILPHGGRAGRLSTNPLCCGFPGADGVALVADCTTAMVAEGKVRLARARGERIPEGWIVDRNGKASTAPEDLYQGGAQLPMAGHKGFCLGLMVELLAGALTGGGCNQPTGPEGPNPDTQWNNLLTIAVDPAATGNAAAVLAEARRFLDWVRTSPAADPAVPVRIPGEHERERERQRSTQPLTLEPATVVALRRAADAAGADLDALLAAAR